MKAEYSDETNGFHHKETPKGCKLIEREPNQLLLDIDSRSIPKDFCQKLYNLHELFNATPSARYLPSRHGNWHVIVDLPFDVSDEMAISLQLFLGSDPIREFMSMGRVLCGVPNPTILFSPEN